MVARKTQSRGEVAIKKNEDTFSRKQITMPKNHKTREQVPARVIIIFIFALVFCLFSIYKVFIHGKGYNLSGNQLFNFSRNTTEAERNTLNTFLWGENQNLTIPSNENTNNENLPQEETSNTEASTVAIDTNSTGSLAESWDTTINNPLSVEETKVLSSFYQNLANGEIEKMNTFVHAPLRKSQTWKSHWNEKNIWIFRKHLAGELQLGNIFLIPGSMNKEKNTKQYSYTLSYTIAPNHTFNEDWKVTLLTTASGENLISEIMCTTKGCSRSPFFWPQNYNLK